MGDSTSVILYVLTTQKDRAVSLFDEHANEDYEYQDDQWVFEFNEVNYGELRFLHKLKEAGIAYDSNWSGGHEYSEGTASCRFTAEGVCIEKEVYDFALNPALYELIKLIDQPEALRKYILSHQETIAVLPLDSEQEANGKLYLAHKLIGATPITKAE